MDVWSEKCLPPGTVHLRFPRLVPVCQRLGVDFAPAMVGFEIRRGHSVPVFEGLVVCEEFKDAVMAVCYECQIIEDVFSVITVCFLSDGCFENSFGSGV